MGQGHAGSTYCRRGILGEARRSCAVTPNRFGRYAGVRLITLISIRPTVITIAIGFLRHQTLAPTLRQLALESLADPGVFIGIFNLPFGAVRQSFALSAKLRERAECEVACGPVAGIEVLVIPVFGRNEDGSLLPWADNFFSTRFPQHRIAFAYRDHDHASWSMAVAFLVEARRKNRHMRAHLRV